MAMHAKKNNIAADKESRSQQQSVIPEKEPTAAAKANRRISNRRMSNFEAPELRRFCFCGSTFHIGYSAVCFCRFGMHVMIRVTGRKLEDERKGSL